MTAREMENRSSWPSFFALCFALALVGCSDDGNGTPNADDNANADGGADPTASNSMVDLGSVGEFQIGTNPVSENTPDSFTALVDGAEVPFTFGVQGSWMVVLAFRTHDMFDGEFDVRANITLDGVESGDIWLEGQETFPGGDGWDYYYNLFLPIDDEPPVQGTPVRIVMSVTDGNGTTDEREHAVLAGLADGP